MTGRKNNSYYGANDEWNGNWYFRPGDGCRCAYCRRKAKPPMIHAEETNGVYLITRMESNDTQRSTSHVGKNLAFITERLRVSPMDPRSSSKDRRA